MVRLVVGAVDIEEAGPYQLLGLAGAQVHD
jgi:hypothetical protein